MRKKVLFVLVCFLFLFLANGCNEQNKDKKNDEEIISGDAIRVIYRNPNDYIDKRVKVIGEIFSEPEYDSDGVGFQMFADIKNSDLNTGVYIRNTEAKVNKGCLLYTSRCV